MLFPSCFCAGLLLLAAGSLPQQPARPVPPACTFVLNGGQFKAQHFVIPQPMDVGKRPGAASGYWSARPSVGTELSAGNEKPVGLVLHVPAAGRNKTGTFPLAGGAISNQAGTPADIVLTTGSVTITAYGNRLVGTFQASGMYVDFQHGMKQVLVSLSGGTFNLQRGSDR